MFSALSFVQQHGKITPALNKSDSKRFSTGLRVPNAATDSAAMAIFKKLEAEDVSFQQALRNTNDGVSMVQTAEGTLDSASQLLTRMRELSVQSSNGTYSQEDRVDLNSNSISFETNLTELQVVLNSMMFSFVRWYWGQWDIQVGGDADPSNQIGIDLSNAMDSTNLGFAGASISSQAGASSAVSDLDAALDAINTRRSDLGATQNRLMSSYDNVSTYSGKSECHSIQLG